MATCTPKFPLRCWQFLSEDQAGSVPRWVLPFLRWSDDELPEFLDEEGDSIGVLQSGDWLVEVDDGVYSDRRVITLTNDSFQANYELSATKA
jgi:hypothetical protein